jgi:hypothetical protein
MENTGIDEYECMVLEKAGRFSMKAGLLACCVCAAVGLFFSVQFALDIWGRHHG